MADWKRVLMGAVLCAVAGCGGEPASPKAAGGASAAGTGGTTPGAGSGGGGASTGGSATAGRDSGGGGVGGGAAGGGSCLGQFAEARPVVAEDAMMNINGISVTADELELYYARGSNDGTMPRQVVRRSRTAKNQLFGPVEPLPELAGVCGELPYVNPDISEDGLTLYVTCTQRVDTGLPEGVSPLRVARRASRAGAFTLEAQPLGGVFASAGISADQLTAYTDGEIFDTAPQMFTRAALTETFTGPQPVAGITTALRSLDISSDGLALFGVNNPGNGTTVLRAVRSSPSAPFAAPQPLSLSLSMIDAAQNPAVGAPNITAGCTLYLVVAVQQGYFVFAAAQQ